MKQAQAVEKSALPVKPAKVKADKKAAKMPPKVEAEVAVAKVKGGIGKTITGAILEAKLTNDEILQLVKKTYPASKTTYACVAWYKSKLRKVGEIE